MTTEIAVLNQLGVALAADSAVTISIRESSKVFNSADKLFELSEHFPIGVMINDNMNCFGVPWEIIIKDFRLEYGATARPTVEKWASDFLSFVEEREDIKEVAGVRYANEVLLREVEIIWDYLRSQFWDQNSSIKKRNSVEEILLDAAISRKNDLENGEKIDRLKGVDVSEFMDSREDEFIKTINENFPDPSQELISNILSNVATSLVSKVETNFSSGVIFAGYGQSDAYPSVYSVNVSGYVCDKLKYYDANNGAIVGGLDTGHVISFAQTDVSDRLLEGVDPSFIRKTVSFLTDTVEAIAPLIVDELTPSRARGRQKRIDQVQVILELIKTAYIKTAAIKFRKEFRKEFEGMIAMMPKMELIELAEALISITAIERKATRDQGTVGGPIDVAFISKHEGFVWIKRKHYFDPHLNPRYFWRKYPPQSGREQNDSRELPEAS